MTPRTRYACIVVGGGPAGLAAAAALAVKGIDVALAAAAAPREAAPASDASRAIPAETRTAALFPPAIAMLRRLGAWDTLAPACAALSGIRIVDATGRLLRAPEVLFKASDVGLTDLGFNVPNTALCEALSAAAQRLGVSVLEDGKVLASSEENGLRRLELAGSRTLEAPLVVAADGANSALREAAGIAVSRWAYEQAALAASFAHSRGHAGMSTELHGPDGPCTTVPLGDHRSSLVWMDRPDVIARLAAATPDEFIGMLGQRLGGLLGMLADPGPRRMFPLMGLVARTMGQARTALVGEAGHAMPPIGAQGLNLGLTDAATLADLVQARAAEGGDIGDAGLLAAYDRARSADVHRRVNAVDLLNRSVRPGLWPLGLARGAGLHVVAAIPSLRRRLMREGLFPPAPIPSLMALPAGERLPAAAAMARHPAT